MFIVVLSGGYRFAAEPDRSSRAMLLLVLLVLLGHKTLLGKERAKGSETGDQHGSAELQVCEQQQPSQVNVPTNAADPGDACSRGQDSENCESKDSAKYELLLPTELYLPENHAGQDKNSNVRRYVYTGR